MHKIFFSFKINASHGMAFEGFDDKNQGHQKLLSLLKSATELHFIVFK